MTVRWSRELGVRGRPHGLRHASVTDGLDLGCDVRSVSRFARHASIGTTQIYDDNRQDLGGQVAATIVGQLAAHAEALKTRPMAGPPGS